MERSSHGARARTMSLETMRYLLGELGHPELGRHTVHTTGSKGKGSTSAFIASALSSQFSTSLYSSPHLHSYRERICIDLEPVSEAEFARALSAISELVEKTHRGLDGPVSTFGAMTSLYFWLNRAHQIQWQVVEVGMGGTHDATNVIDEKDLVVISAISLEHTNILGKTTGEIALNKAGIIRPGSKVVLAPQKDPAVVSVIREVCQRLGAAFVDVGAEYELIHGDKDVDWQEFSVNCKKHGRRSFRTQMLGLHQMDNAASAIAAIDALNESREIISSSQLIQSIGQVFVPGRLEKISKEPEIIIDGAHNGESAAALVEGLKHHFDRSSAVFVLGVNSDKNIAQILQAIKPHCKMLIASCSQSEKAMNPKLILEAAISQGIKVELSGSSAEAMERAIELSDGELICATGSLYLIAEVRERFSKDGLAWSLRKRLAEQPFKSQKAI